MTPDGVTIAIPNWNHELMLPRSITSALGAARALAEAGCAGEVLVIDAASRDGSLTLLRQLEALHYDDGLRVLALSENVSLAAARNLALAHARGRYVAFVDADDELVPENLPCLWRALRETGAAAAYGNILKRHLVTGEVFHVFSNESFQDKVFEQNYITCFGVFDRDQLRDAGGYNEDFRTIEDWEQWLHLACAGRQIVFVPVVFGYYDSLPSSMLADSALGSQATQRIHRIFNQLKARGRLDMNTRHLRYHPALGRV